MTIGQPGDGNAQGDQPERGWYGHRQLVWQVGAYLIVNAIFVALWATSGTNGHHGGFWPIWPIVFWGAAVAFFGLRTLTSKRR